MKEAYSQCGKYLTIDMRNKIRNNGTIDLSFWLCHYIAIEIVFKSFESYIFYTKIARPIILYFNNRMSIVQKLIIQQNESNPVVINV